MQLPLRKWRHDRYFQSHEVYLAHVVAFFLLTAVCAGAWDIWWHIAVGRESLFIAPHLLLYITTGSAILAAIYGWIRTREKLWAHLAGFLVFVPLLAPFDEMWHRIYGIENLSTPMIVWSPPHMALIAVFFIAFWLLFPLLKLDRNAASRRFFECLVIASLIIMVFLPVAPFEPLGPYHVFGFWGAGITVGVTLLGFFLARHIIGGTGTTILTAAFVTLFMTVINENVTPAEGVIFPSYPHPPVWALVASILAPAVWLDFDRMRHLVLTGAIAGMIAGLFRYAAAYIFLPPDSYTIPEACIGIIASTIGGAVAGYVGQFLLSKR